VIGVCLVLLVAGRVLVDKWRVYEVEQLEKKTGVDLLEVGAFLCLDAIIIY